MIEGSQESPPAAVQLHTRAEGYIRDHNQIVALIDAEHPLHTASWEQLRSMAARVIARLGGARLQGHGDEVDDLVQESIQQLWHSLSSFRYESSLSTWQYRVIAQSLNVRQRALLAQKRGARARLHSLDELAERAAPHAEQGIGEPDHAAFEQVLSDMIIAVLEQQGDQRLRWVFEQAIYQQQPLRRIADQLAISQTRAHGLLQQARQILRANPDIRDWFEADLRQPPQA